MLNNTKHSSGATVESRKRGERLAPSATGSQPPTLL